MKKMSLRQLWLCLLIPLLNACSGMGAGGGNGNNLPDNPAPSPTSPAAAANDIMRVGDKITIRLTGVPDQGYINEVQIPPSGTVTVPLLTQSFPAAGHTTADLAEQITAAYKDQKIYTTPNVAVLPEERFVSVGGDVRSPTRVLYTSDLTLMTAINACGGFDEYANKRTVRVIRGGQVMTIDCVNATHMAGGDPPLYPGDQIFVPRTIF
jgi:protein involved in polysaccharide export with SLBB domain